MIDVGLTRVKAFGSIIVVWESAQLLVKDSVMVQKIISFFTGTQKPVPTPCGG